MKDDARQIIHLKSRKLTFGAIQVQFYLLFFLFVRLPYGTIFISSICVSRSLRNLECVYTGLMDVNIVMNSVTESRYISVVS